MKMLRLGFIGLMAAVLITPTEVKASEDMDSFVFGDEIPVEEMEGVKNKPVTWHEENAPILQSSMPTEDKLSEPTAENISEPIMEDFAPPPSNVLLNSNSNNMTNKEDVPLPTISDDKTLTETLKSDTGAEKPSIPLPNVENTWVGKLAEQNPISLLKNDEKKKQVSKENISLESLVEGARQNGEYQFRRSNA